VHGSFSQLLIFPALAWLALGAGVVSGAEKSPATITDAWDEAARLLVNDAQRSFLQLSLGSEADARTILFGQAVTLINVQPKTNGNIAQAKKLFAEIIAGHPTDDLTIASRFLLARTAQLHQLPTNDAEAIELYTDLIARHPQHYFGQMAYAKRAALLAYQLSAATTLESRYQTIQQEAPLVTAPDARRDHQLLLANLAIVLKKPPTVILAHLTQAEATGMVRDRALADLYVRLGEFARLAEQREVAIHYYNAFLNNYIRDARRLLVKERLAALQNTRPNLPASLTGRKS
jgi:hypothetical protein